MKSLSRENTQKILLILIAACENSMKEGFNAINEFGSAFLSIKKMSPKSENYSIVYYLNNGFIDDISTHNLYRLAVTFVPYLEADPYYKLGTYIKLCTSYLEISLAYSHFNNIPIGSLSKKYLRAYKNF